MKRKRWVAIFLVFAFLFGVMTSGMGAAPLQESEKVDLLIGFHGTPNRGLVEAFGGEVYREFTIVDVIAARMPQRAAEALAQNPAVRYVEPDGVVYALGQEVPWGIDRVFGDEKYSFETWSGSKGAGIGVAVLDTGIDTGHEDLIVKGGRRFYTTGPILREDDQYNDGHGHGTHVAGTIAAVDNNIGVVGVAPVVDLYAVKVLTDSGSGSVSAIIAGIEWSVARKDVISIINMSLGSSSYSQAFNDACDNAYTAGLLLVASAGNSGNSGGTGDNVGYPAKYDSVIAVAASDSNDERASFSSTGPDVELIAPGVSIRSAWKDNSYRLASGTSMASPHVAGVAALVWAADSRLDNVGVREILKNTAEKLGSPELPLTHQGHGLVRADLAVRAVVDVGQPATGNIQGTVRNKGDTAIGGAIVVVEGTSLSSSTDANGYYFLGGVLVGAQNVTASADGHYSKTMTVTVMDNATVTQDFVLEAISPTPTYTVSGTVKDTKDGALGAATVNIEGTGHSATTGNDGSYSIVEVEEGTYNITASKDGCSSQTKTVTVNSDTTVDFVLNEISHTGDLSIDKFEIFNTSNPAWARATVEWAVSSSDGLASVKTEMILNGSTVDSKTSSVSGDSVSGTHELRNRGGHGRTYDIKLTVTDIKGNTVSETKTISL